MSVHDKKADRHSNPFRRGLSPEVAALFAWRQSGKEVTACHADERYPVPK